MAATLPLAAVFSECSWYDESQGTLTRQKLYVTENNEQVYYIVRSSGSERSRHAYKLFMRGDVRYPQRRYRNVPPV